MITIIASSVPTIHDGFRATAQAHVQPLQALESRNEVSMLEIIHNTGFTNFLSKTKS